MAEFPDLGKHCTYKECKQLDFLPVTCDACKQPFCVNHFQYINHSCSRAVNKDRQVPVCPLCSKPVPIPHGRSLDEVMSFHLDSNCAKPTMKLSFPCDLKGCKKREFIEVTCRDCKHNFCLGHRFNDQHFCKGNGPKEKLKARATTTASSSSPMTNTANNKNLERTLHTLWNCRNSNGISDEKVTRQPQVQETARQHQVQKSARQPQAEEKQHARRQKDSRSRVGTFQRILNGCCIH